MIELRVLYPRHKEGQGGSNNGDGMRRERQERIRLHLGHEMDEQQGQHKQSQDNSK